MGAALLLAVLSQFGLGLSTPVVSSPAQNRSGPKYTLNVDYEWPNTSTLASICTGDSECVGLCAVGVRTGSATAWECIDNTGAALGTVTNPGTAAVIDSFIAKGDGTYFKALDITAASQAPDLVSTAVDAIYGQVPSTTVMVALGRASGRVNGIEWLLDGYPGGAVGYMQMAIDFTGTVEGSTGAYCATSGSLVNSAGVMATDAWAIMSCRTNGANDGTSTKKIDVGLTSSSGTGGLRRSMQAGTHYIFGADNARTNFVNGPIALWVAFNTNKSDAFMRSLQGKIWRDYNAAGVATPVAGSTVRPEYLDHAPYTGNVDPLWNLAPMVEAKGLRTSRSHINTWAANTLAATTWTDVGTPIVTSDVSSGPFSVARHGAECDLIVDDDAAAFEGKQGLESWDGGAGLTTTVNFTNNCFLKAGTTGTVTTKARLTWSTDGTSSNASCDITGLTSTATRAACTSLIGGASTLKPRLLVGNAASDTGSIQACGCFNTEGTGLEPPRPDNTVVPDFYYTLDPVADGWPNFSTVTAGKVEIVHTPYFDPAAPSVQPVVGTPDYLVDIDNAGDLDHSTGVVFGYTGQGELLGIFRKGGTVSDILVTGITLVADHTYATATAWQSVGGGKCKLFVYHSDCGATAPTSCHAKTLVGANLTGTATCPAAPTGVHLGNRFSNTVGTSTRINALRILTVP